jgi:hypothetical protein
MLILASNRMIVNVVFYSTTKEAHYAHHTERLAGLG